MPVYVIERRFAEQLDMTSDEVKLLEEINADEGVSWLFSFLSADRHRSYCLYEAPTPDAIIAAARRRRDPGRRRDRGQPDNRRHISLTPLPVPGAGERRALRARRGVLSLSRGTRKRRDPVMGAGAARRSPSS